MLQTLIGWNKYEQEMSDEQPLDEDMETNIQNITYPGKIMSICNKQQLSNI